MHQQQEETRNKHQDGSDINESWRPQEYRLLAPQVSPEDLSEMEPWLHWVEDYARFFLACLRRWVQARASASAAPDQAHADRLPCARLLCDSYLFKSLTEVCGQRAF